MLKPDTIRKQIRQLHELRKSLPSPEEQAFYRGAVMALVWCLGHVGDARPTLFLHSIKEQEPDTFIRYLQ